MANGLQMTRSELLSVIAATATIQDCLFMGDQDAALAQAQWILSMLTKNAEMTPAEHAEVHREAVAFLDQRTAVMDEKFEINRQAEANLEARRQANADA